MSRRSIERRACMLALLLLPSVPAASFSGSAHAREGTGTAQDAPALDGSATDDPAADRLVHQARDHFQRGVRLYREGNNDAAFAEFVRAQELAPSFRILYNLAQVQAERRDYAAALGFFSQYLREGGALISPERRAEVGRAQAELADHVGQLVVAADVPGAQLYVNGVAAATLPLGEPLLVNAGRCDIRLEQLGREPAARSLVIASGQLLEVALSLEPVARPSTRPPLPGPSKRQGLERSFWIGVAATAAFGSATAAFAFATALADKPLALDASAAERESARAAHSRLKTYALLTGGFGAATLLSAGAATYFLLASDGGGSEAPPGNAGPSARSPSPKAARLTARVVPTPSGVYVFGQF